MFFSASMRKVDLIIMSKHVDAVTRTLGRLGVMHLVNTVGERHAPGIASDNMSGDIQKFENLGKRAFSLLHKTDNPENRIASTDEKKDFAAYNSALEMIERDMGEIDARITELNHRMTKIEADLLEFKRISFINIDLERFLHLEYAQVYVGTCAADHLEILKQKLTDRAIVSVYTNALGQEKVILFFSRKNKWSVSDELNRCAFQKEEISDEYSGIPSVNLLTRKEEYDRLQENLREREKERKTFLEQHKDALLEISDYAGYCLNLLRARGYFAKTQSLYFISGWVPEKNVARLEKEIRAATGDAMVMSVRSPSDLPGYTEGTLKVPALLGNRRLFKPFEKIITTFGTPSYQEIEPTVFVAITFILMFGIMFGDVGQGLILFLAGLYLYKIRHPKLANASSIGFIIMSVSVSSMIFGFLYGSVFGSDKILPGLWGTPLKNITMIFKLAIFLGILLNSFGIILNMINQIRRRNYYAGILDRFGLVGIIFYWGAIGIGIKHLVFNYKEVKAWEIILLIVIPMLILFFREPIFNLYKRRPKLIHEDVFSYGVESLMGLLEMVLMLAANTISFIRVGAFALSHAAICMVIMSVAQMLRRLEGGSLFSFVFIVFGNLFVIALEGMVVFIQTLRLEYYEFFGKFFKGEGVEYKPFNLALNHPDSAAE